MVAFYNQGDQNIYKDFQYVPQEKYRLGFTAPTTTPTAAPVSGGITNTNAFTNSGGNGFNQSGNAFGYGSPVSEVNVRTFNPQSNDPTGSVANAQTMYNKASNAGPMVETFTGMRPSESVMDYYGGQIMDNREQYGAQGQYNSPYDDTVDLGYLGRDTSTSIQRNRGTLGKAIDFVTDFIPGVGAVKRGAKFIGGLLPDNPNGPGGGTYGVAGLSDAQKEQYNALANQGMLFSGSSGMKTSTGKNFTGKGYLEGQMDLAKGFGFDTMTEEEIEEQIATMKANPKKQFKYKQMLEASQMYKTNKAQEKNKENMANLKAAESRRESARQYDPAVHGPTNYGLGSDGNQSYDSGNQGFGTNATSGGPVSNKTGRGRTDYMEGGRAGYFFGGRARLQGGGMSQGNEENQKQSAEMGNTTVSNNNNNGVSDNPPVTVVNNNPLDISTVTKSVGNYDIPVGLEALMADKGKLQAVLNADNVLDKNLGAEFTYDNGPFSIGAYADMDGDKSLNANYTRNNSNYSFDLNDGGGQLKFTRTFANGGLAGLL